MNNLWLLLATLLCAAWSFSAEAQRADISTLKFLHAIWRHGDRSPASTFPSDIANPESSWPQGWGELTERGIRDHYQLGQWIRNRYDGFIGRNYSKYEIFVQSTGYNRTIMSAMANMAGLFEPTPAQQWDKSIPLGRVWQPIPVHNRPREEDPFWMDMPCPTAEKLYKNLIDSPEVVKIEDQYAELLKFLGEKSAMNQTIKLDHMWNIFDPLNCEFAHSDTHTVPAWVTSEAGLWDKIVHLYDLSMMFYYYTPAIQRLRGGVMLKDIMDRLLAKTNGTLEDRFKFYVYSMHDTNVAALLASLGAIQERHPIYASAIFIELHQRNGSYFVEVYFKNGTASSDLHRIAVSECGATVDGCTLELFVERSRTRVPDDWYKECGLRHWYDVKAHTFLAVLCIMIGMGVVLLSFVAAHSVQAYKRHKHRYGDRLLLPTENPDEFTSDTVS